LFPKTLYIIKIKSVLHICNSSKFKYSTRKWGITVLPNIHTFILNWNEPQLPYFLVTLAHLTGGRLGVWQPIFGKIGEMTFIQQLEFKNGFQYRNFDLQLLNYGNILATFFCNYNDDQSSNPGDYESRNCTILDETAKISIITQNI